MKFLTLPIIILSFLNAGNTNVSKEEKTNVGVKVTNMEGNTLDGGHIAQFRLSLTKKPTHDVNITLFSSNSKEGVVITDRTLTFTPKNWRLPQYVTIRGTNYYVEGNNQNYTICSCPGKESG